MCKREVNTIAITHTFTNPETGISLTTPDRGVDRVTVKQDGSFTVFSVGLFGRFVVKGEGLEALRVGAILFTFDAQGNLVQTTFVGGKFDILRTAICELLAPQQ
jgi:hypothetical protein